MADGLENIPDPGERSVPRYSTRTLPAYRYVPGLRPHPTRDPRGHSYEPAPRRSRHPAWDPENWGTVDDWLYGVDLFNRFYFWEAHEAWEGLWATSARGSAPSLLLHGLIQIAAALLKVHLGVVGGAQRLSAHGLDKLRRAAAAQRHILGLNLDTVVRAFTRYFAPLQHNELPRIGTHVPALRLAGSPAMPGGKSARVVHRRG